MNPLVGIVILVCRVVGDPSGEPADPKPAGEVRYSLSLADEGVFADDLRVPGADKGNLLLLQSSLAYRHGQRWRASSSLALVTRTQGDTHVQLRVKEAYLGYSAGDFDFTAGKRLVRWGTGYAFTATGVLDPPRIATDPTDRLNLNEGRELVKADWIRGSHDITVAWASAGLVANHRTGMRETFALRYNVLVSGFDTSVIMSKDRGGPTFGGANFTRVFGESVEAQGELAYGRGDGRSARREVHDQVGSDRDRRVLYASQHELLP